MSYPWKELSPKDPLIIRQPSFVSDIDKKVITFLYQPIIGPQAYSLYMTLLTKVSQETYHSKNLLHADLLATLSIGIPEFYQARLRLEGIGLLNSHLKTGDEKAYIYEPCAPLSSKKFFEEDLLRLLLRECVGESKLAELVDNFSLKKWDKTTATNITKSFLSVYNFSPDLLKNEKNNQGESHQQLVEAENGKAPQVAVTTFRYAYLKQLLQGEFFNQEAMTDELKHTIGVLHTMYGIDEVAMSQYLLRVTDLETGKVNIRELQQTVADSFGKGKRTVRDKVAIEMKKPEEERVARQAQLEKAGYTIDEIKLVQLSERLTPIAFITKLKKQKNGSVTASEKTLMTTLLDQYGMTPAVLNMLSYYILIVQDNPTMAKGLTETIANDWMQSGIKQPEQAIDKTKQFIGQKKAAAEKRQENRSGRYYGKNVVRKVEKLPEWAKNQDGPVTEALLPDDVQKKFNERLKKFRSGGKVVDE